MNLELKGIQGVINELARVKTEVSQEVEAELQAGVNTMVRDAKRKAPANFGQLRASIGSEQTAPLQFSFFASAYHAPYVEFGTRGKVDAPAELQALAKAIEARPKKGTWKQFVNAILIWGEKKKVIAKGDKGHAYVIARKIYKEGIAPQPFMWPSFVANRGKLIQRIERIVKEKR